MGAEGLERRVHPGRDRHGSDVGELLVHAGRRRGHLRVLHTGPGQRGNYEAAPGAADDSTLYDATGPTVASIARTGSAGNPTDAASVQWLVTYSESVSGVDDADFELATTGVTGASITGVTGTGATRTVTASTGSGSGTIGLAALDNDTITDDLGNNLQAGLAEDAAWRYTIDKPSVVSLNRTSAENPTNDATVTWTATFSEPVSGVDSADFTRVLAGGVDGGSITSVDPVGGRAGRRLGRSSSTRARATELSV